MNTLITKAALGLTLGATALTVAAPAEAQRYHRRHHDNTGTAVVAGIAGLAIGAALASSSRGYDRGYYDRGHYYDRGYYPRRGYYAPPPRAYYRGCTVRRVWDPYLERRVRVRYCR